MKAAHGGEVSGEGVGVSSLQLLDQELDVGGDEFPVCVVGLLAVDGLTVVVAALLMVFLLGGWLLLFMPCVA